MYGAFPSMGLDLVQQVKNLQRESEHAKRCWHDFCDAHGAGVRDPGRHPVEYLRHFIDAYRGGMLPPPSAASREALHEKRVPADGSGDPREVLDMLIAKVKHGQRTSQTWKELWWTYCDSHQDGVRDPGRHDETSLRTFLEEFAPRVGVGSGDSASSRDRGSSRDDPPPAGLPPGSGVSALAERVKQMQRRHESYKERWAWYCDTFGNGIRDPARHTPQFLQQYITMVEGGGNSQSAPNRAGHQFHPYGANGMPSSGWGGYPGYPFGYPGYGQAAYPMMYPGFGFGSLPMLMYGAGATPGEKSKKRSKTEKAEKAVPAIEDKESYDSDKSDQSSDGGSSRSS